MPTETAVFTSAQLTAMVDGFLSMVTGNIGPILLVFGAMFGVSFIFRKLGAAKNGRV